MNAFIQNMSGLTAEPSVALVADLALKSLLVLAVAGAASLALRRASAAARHLVWCVGVVSVLLLPLLTTVLPHWRVAVLPRWTTDVSDQSDTSDASPRSPAPPYREAAESWSASSPGIAAHEAAPQPIAAQADARATKSVWSFKLSRPVCIGLGWGLGAVAVLAPLLVGVGVLKRMIRRARRMEGGAWTELLSLLSEKLDLDRPVRLLETGSAAMPMTWGHWRPVVLLPAEADAWPEERRCVVLLHELAHVKRWDCLPQILAWLACALFWFNPLVWVAAWRMRVERERACDDLVLAAGSRASDYADHLLDIATNLRGRSFASALAIAMARRSTLEGRLLAILDAKRNRRSLTRRSRVASSTRSPLTASISAARTRGGFSSRASANRTRRAIRSTRLRKTPSLTGTI
ncbi:MAG: M56 family metallopeptidase [Verrucomicrobia bacterium]|nr:M56 family metallopeptidase [Verrucomicrobiota bacterium]